LLLNILGRFIEINRGDEEEKNRNPYFEERDAFDPAKSVKKIETDDSGEIGVIERKEKKKGKKKKKRKGGISSESSLSLLPSFFFFFFFSFLFPFFLFIAESGII